MLINYASQDSSGFLGEWRNLLREWRDGRCVETQKVRQGGLSNALVTSYSTVPAGGELVLWVRAVGVGAKWVR